MAAGRLIRVTCGSNVVAHIRPGFAKQGSSTAGHPVEFRHWQEVVAEADSAIEAAAYSEEEEAAVELWLESPELFNGQLHEEGAQRTAGSMVRRADTFGRKQGVVRQQSNWDQEFSDAQAHAASVLKNLGNAR